MTTFRTTTLGLFMLCAASAVWAQSAPTDAQRALIAEHYKVFNAGFDAGKILPNTTTADWKNCGANGENCITLEATVGALAGIKQSVPDLKWEVLDVLAAGDKLIVRGQGSGTPTGSFMGQNTTGRSFKIMSIDIQTVRNGKIAHTHHLEDWSTAQGQLFARGPR